jgi:hypothetical protein
MKPNDVVTQLDVVKLLQEHKAELGEVASLKLEDLHVFMVRGPLLRGGRAARSCGGRCCLLALPRGLQLGCGACEDEGPRGGPVASEACL